MAGDFAHAKHAAVEVAAHAAPMLLGHADGGDPCALPDLHVPSLPSLGLGPCATGTEPRHGYDQCILAFRTWFCICREGPNCHCRSGTPDSCDGPQRNTCRCGVLAIKLVECLKVLEEYESEREHNFAVRVEPSVFKCHNIDIRRRESCQGISGPRWRLDSVVKIGRNERDFRHTRPYPFHIWGIRS